MRTNSYISIYSRNPEWLERKAKILYKLGWVNQGMPHWSTYKKKWTMGVWR